MKIQVNQKKVFMQRLGLVFSLMLMLADLYWGNQMSWKRNHADPSFLKAPSGIVKPRVASARAIVRRNMEENITVAFSPGYVSFVKADTGTANMLP